MQNPHSCGWTELSDLLSMSHGSRKDEGIWKISSLALGPHYWGSPFPLRWEYDYHCACFFNKRTFPGLAWLGPNNNLFLMLWLCQAKKPNTSACFREMYLQSLFDCTITFRAIINQNYVCIWLCVCMRVREEWRHMGAIINLSHFITGRGKEKAKFTGILNIVDSSHRDSDK